MQSDLPSEGPEGYSLFVTCDRKEFKIWRKVVEDMLLGKTMYYHMVDFLFHMTRTNFPLSDVVNFIGLEDVWALCMEQWRGEHRLTGLHLLWYTP